MVPCKVVTSCRPKEVRWLVPKRGLSSIPFLILGLRRDGYHNQHSGVRVIRAFDKGCL